MQPAYPNPFQPQNPMQPQMPPAGQFPAPSYQPPQPVQYPQTPQAAPRPMTDIAPPQPSYPQTQPRSATLNTAPNTARFASSAPRPMTDIAPPQPVQYPQTPQNPMQPQMPPAGQFPAPSYQPPPPPSRPQFVQNIPIHAPSQTTPPSHQPYSPPQQAPMNPFNQPGPATPAPVYSDNRMEDILKDVNRDVSKPESKPTQRNLPKITDRLKLTKLKHHTRKAVTQPKPMMVVVLAAVTFLSLATAAFFAFNNDSKAQPTGPEVKVVGTTSAAGDSIQASGGTLVSPQEVEDLSANLKKQINGFNESQDFSQEPLSDQALGL